MYVSIELLLLSDHVLFPPHVLVVFVTFSFVVFGFNFSPLDLNSLVGGTHGWDGP